VYHGLIPAAVRLAEIEKKFGCRKCQLKIIRGAAFAWQPRPCLIRIDSQLCAPLPHEHGQSQTGWKAKFFVFRCEERADREM
jgi:hypothetical protein